MELGAVHNDVVRLLNERGGASLPEVDNVPGAVSCGVFEDAHADRFERLRSLIEQLATPVDTSPWALALLLEIQVELDELEKGPGLR